jgi:hypothetical protein
MAGLEAAAYFNAAGARGLHSKPQPGRCIKRGAPAQRVRAREGRCLVLKAQTFGARSTHRRTARPPCKPKATEPKAKYSLGVH